MLDDDPRLRHFEALYAAGDDPWDVRGSWYERRKRTLLLACLRKPRYRSVFEPGCGNGEMSASLAARADALLACDASPSAIGAARRRLAELDIDAGVVPAIGCDLRIEERSLPAEWPQDGRFDLIVMSELAYYFDAAALGALFGMARDSLSLDGELLLCHYLPDFDDRVTSTAEVHAQLGATPGLVRTLRHLDGEFLIESWTPAVGSAS
jgi:SAM-dependent methyltransferase